MGRIADAQAAFEEVYAKDLWGLGTGEWNAPREGELSEDERTRLLVATIQEFLRVNEIRSVVEFGCGFWTYAKHIDWTGIRYDGFDVFEGALRWNRDQFGSDTIRFHRVTDGAVLPAADLLISKDVLQHLPIAHVQYYLAVFRKTFRFMLIGNDAVPVANMNGEVAPGGYRALRLELPPFNLPNAVLHRWETWEYGIPTVKNFCLFYGDAVGSRTGTILRDLSDAAEPAGPSATARRRGPVRRVARALVVRIPPLARLTGRILETLRDRRG